MTSNIIQKILIVGMLLNSEVIFADALKKLHERVKHFGWIPFRLPMANRAPGSLVHGGPEKMELYLPSHFCFTDFHKPYPNELALPIESKVKTTSLWFSGEFLERTNSDFADDQLDMKIEIGASFDAVEKVEVYFDSATAYEYYPGQFRFAEIEDFNEHCVSSAFNDYPVIYQSLMVKEMKIVLYKSNDSRVELDATNLEDYLDIGIGVDWEIEENHTLVIKRPHYIGYKLLQLKVEKDDEGKATEVLPISLSNSSKNGEWIFNPLPYVHSLRPCHSSGRS